MLNIPPFRNEPFTDFTDERHAHDMAKSIEVVENQLGREYPIIVNGQKLKTGDLQQSLNPSKFSEVIGNVHSANREIAEKTIDAAWKAFDSWKRLPADVRASYLLKAAAEMRRRKF